MLNQNTKSLQTAFRFPPSLLTRMKNRARLRGMSLNSYVESLAEKDLENSSDLYETLYEDLSDVELPEDISSEIMSLSEFRTEFSQEELDSDEKLRYLLSK